MKVTQITPVHAANLVANSGNTPYGVDVLDFNKPWKSSSLLISVTLRTAGNGFETLFKSTDFQIILCNLILALGFKYYIELW